MKFGIVKWDKYDGIADALEYELLQMGHHPVTFLHSDNIPVGLDIVLTFAPYRRFYPVAQRIGNLPAKSRPVFIHWASENIPDLRLPKPIVLAISRIRSFIDRMQDSTSPGMKRIAYKSPFSVVNSRFHRFRHIGDYLDAYHNGWLDILADVSIFYADYFKEIGIPAIYVPWGTSSLWYEDLGLERDIGVTWMGKRRTRHRSSLIDQVENEMKHRGIAMYIADGLRSPFIFNEQRTEILNRTMITLNLQYINYIHTLPLRFGFAAGNRSLVLAEKAPNHSPELIPGKHFVEAPADQIVEQILYYLENQEEREQVTASAFTLATTQLTMQNSLKRLISTAEKL